MKKLEDPNELLKEAVGHPEFRGLIHRADVHDKAAREQLDKLIQAYVTLVIDAEYKTPEASLAPTGFPLQPNPAANPAASAAMGALKIRMETALRHLQKYFKPDDVKRLEAFALRFVQAGIKLFKTPQGIHYKVDEVRADCHYSSFVRMCFVCFLIQIVTLNFSLVHGDQQASIFHRWTSYWALLRRHCVCFES
jgi:hypothetical protein